MWLELGVVGEADPGSGTGFTQGLSTVRASLGLSLLRHQLPLSPQPLLCSGDGGQNV